MIWKCYFTDHRPQNTPSPQPNNAWYVRLDPRLSLRSWAAPDSELHHTQRPTSPEPASSRPARSSSGANPLPPVPFGTVRTLTHSPLFCLAIFALFCLERHPVWSDKQVKTFLAFLHLASPMSGMDSAQIYVQNPWQYCQFLAAVVYILYSNRPKGPLPKLHKSIDFLDGIIFLLHFSSCCPKTISSFYTDHQLCVCHPVKFRDKFIYFPLINLFYAWLS